MNACLFELLETRTLLSGLDVSINFEPARSPVPAGYLADTGARFGPHGKLSYGWSRDNSANAVDRGGRASRGNPQYTFLPLQAGRKALRWDIAVPDGSYRVQISAGDRASFGNVYRIRAEKSLVVDATSTRRGRWVRGDAVVQVSDGRLSITPAKGAVRSAINWIRITAVTPERDGSAQLQAGTADVVQGATVRGTSVESRSAGGYLLFRGLRLDPKFLSVQVFMAESATQDGQQIEFHLDSLGGPLIAALNTEGAGDGSAFWKRSAQLNQAVSGAHDLYVVFKGAVGTIDWIQFSKFPYADIMPLGDSITEGNNVRESYRHRLWDLLMGQNFSIDFVGSRSGVRPGTGDPASFAYDQQHEGHSGMATGDIAGQLQEWLSGRVGPRAVLLHAGTNDLLRGVDPAVAAANVARMIDLLRASNPNIVVFVAKIIPSTQIATATTVAYNNLLASLAAQKNTKQSRIIMVDQFSGFDAQADTYDGIHPNDTGEIKIAQKWYQALITPL